MVFIVDDLLYSITIGPLVSIMEIIYDHALKEMYPLDKINNEIKENRMLYEFGELTKEEYEERKNKLVEKQEMAKKVRGMGARLNILGTGG